MKSIPPASAKRFVSAIHTFAGAVAYTRCFTYPSRADRVGPLWVIRDEPRKRPEYRREEWVGFETDPKEVDSAARAGTRGRFCICDFIAMGDDDLPVRERYKSLGYRYHCAEAFMLHPLARIPKVADPYPLQRITAAELADAIAKAAGRRQILPEHLTTDKPLRLYAAFDGDKPIGWLRSITVGDSTWVSNVHTQPKYRRQGVGKSLLAKMLRDDRKFGSKQSVLTATQAGAFLYERVGFEQLGKLLMFTPVRK